MGILKHKPLFLWIVTGFLAFVGLLISLEIYRMPLIFWTLQNVSYGIARPVIGIVRRCVPRCPACLLKMDCRRYALANLSEQRRTVLLMNFFLGYSERKIGNEYGRNRSTVNYWKLAALKQLRKELEETKHEE